MVTTAPAFHFIALLIHAARNISPADSLFTGNGSSSKRGTWIEGEAEGTFEGAWSNSYLITDSQHDAAAPQTKVFISSFVAPFHLSVGDARVALPASV